MKIYGVALLAVCYLVGKFIGNLLGKLINIDGDIGGVGFAIVLLMFSASFLRKKGWMPDETEKGILFWTSIYIPIIVAMAAIQNVKAAVSGGPIALVVGIGATIVAFLLVPVLSKIGKKDKTSKN